MMTISLSPTAHAIIAKLGMTPELAFKICGAMDKENQLSVDAIKQKISGSPEIGLRGSQTLHRRTGRLRDSIGRTDTLVTNEGGNYLFRSGVGSGIGQGSQSVRYAAIHEFGGSIRVPEIVPTKARALRFSIGGRTVFAKRVKAHTVNMPERSYIRSTLIERKNFYKRRIGTAIIRHMKDGDSNV